MNPRNQLVNERAEGEARVERNRAGAEIPRRNSGGKNRKSIPPLLPSCSHVGFGAGASRGDAVRVCGRGLGERRALQFSGEIFPQMVIEVWSGGAKSLVRGRAATRSSSCC